MFMFTSVCKNNLFYYYVLHYICEHGMEDLKEENLKDMLTFANAAASVITTRKGALRVMPTREEVQNLLIERAAE